MRQKTRHPTPKKGLKSDFLSKKSVHKKCHFLYVEFPAGRNLLCCLPQRRGTKTPFFGHLASSRKNMSIF